ncbi:tripartite motif-containing protein 2-like [Haliotis rufescens]|uniref:tripartite motif-containing protein 2-like n=1 Tax=Haliotis rufescens TaxID=6454 RepID=UPI00201F9C45|nr:tripartite motif-containing protein 2-like [Haliotis rufescens]
MATSQKLREHFLTCTICTEVFVNPCTLVCYHTFCRKCVVNYTKTRPEAISAKSLICPFCSKLTKVPEPERPVEEWAHDVKPSFVMQGLLDSFGPASKDTTYCAYCKEDGETTPAAVWCSVCDDALCEKCVRVHSRIPSTRHHDVTDLCGEVKVQRMRKVMCDEHKQECIEFVCKDCRKAVCHKCCTLHHRKCDLVVTIESEILPMKTELTKKKETLSKKQEDTKAKTDELKSILNKEASRYAQMEEDIMSITQKAIEQIKLKERKLLDDLKEMSDRHIGQLKAHIKSRELSQEMCQQEAELIDQALQSECDMDVYEMHRGYEAGDVEAVGELGLAERDRIARVTFRHDMEKLSKTLGELQLGELDVLYEGVVDLKGDPVLQDTINVRIAGDRYAAWVGDVTVIEVDGTDTVVVTDINNNSVKSFYTRNNQLCHSRLSLSRSPHSLSKLIQNQLAVTVPGMKQIVTVEANPDLELLSTITTSKQYWGLTYLTPSTLAASSQSPPCVDILDVTGTVLRSFSPLHNGNNMLKYPTYLCTTRTGNILVTDQGSKCVVCVTPGGDVVFTFRPTGVKAPENPRGVTSTSTGDILVTDVSLHRVIHLTESGQFVRNILTSEDGIEEPIGVDVDGRRRMYVGLYYQGVVMTYMS